MVRAKDISGEFGRLSVVKRAGTNKYRAALWLCVCRCGKEVVVRGASLRDGSTKSCGCLQKDKAALIGERSYKHGHYKHPLCFVFYAMRERCYNEKNPAYKHYGERGITIFDSWLKDIDSFVKWGKKNGWEKGLQIDRINNNEGYYPDNCRFVTARENTLNTRPLQKNNTSGYAGVNWYGAYNKWASVICVKGKRKRLGYYKEKKDALLARNEYIMSNNLQGDYKIQEWS